jgi:hypothetical protein
MACTFRVIVSFSLQSALEAFVSRLSLVIFIFCSKLLLLLLLCIAALGCFACTIMMLSGVGGGAAAVGVVRTGCA